MIRDAVVVADVQGIIVQVNEKAVQMFDYDDKSEMIGKSCEILMPTGVARYHNAYMQRYRDTKESRLIGKPRRVLAKKKGGEEFPIHINLAELIRVYCLPPSPKDITLFFC